MNMDFILPIKICLIVFCHSFKLNCKVLLVISTPFFNWPKKPQTRNNPELKIYDIFDSLRLAFELDKQEMLYSH